MTDGRATSNRVRARQEIAQKLAHARLHDHTDEQTAEAIIHWFECCTYIFTESPWGR